MQIDSYRYAFIILKTKLIKTLIWNQISWVKSRECRGGLTTHWHRRQYTEENTSAQRVISIINKFDIMILRKFCKIKTTHYQSTNHGLQDGKMCSPTPDVTEDRYFKYIPKKVDINKEKSNLKMNCRPKQSS